MSVSNPERCYAIAVLSPSTFPLGSVSLAKPEFGDLVVFPLCGASMLSCTMPKRVASCFIHPANSKVQNAPPKAAEICLPVLVSQQIPFLLGREMAHLALLVHTASFAVSTTSSPAAKEADRPSLSFPRWIATHDCITSLMNAQGCSFMVQVGFVWQLSQQRCSSRDSNACRPQATPHLYRVRRHPGT